MSSRERWIVYPLLFLTLGIAVRDKIIPAHRLQMEEIAANQIRCNQLQVDQEIGAKQISCNCLQSPGEVAARSMQCNGTRDYRAKRSANGSHLTEPKTKGGFITTLSPAGVPLVLLQPTDSGGVVVASEFVRGSSVPSGKPKTSSAPSPKQPSKEPEKSPPNATP